MTNVQIGPSESAFTDPFKIEISFEALEALQHQLIWKVVYVGDADSQEHD